MKVSIQIEIPDDLLIKSVDNAEALQDLIKAISTRVQIAIKEDVAKTVIQVCNTYKIPLGDLVKSED